MNKKFLLGLLTCLFVFGSPGIAQSGTKYSEYASIQDQAHIYPPEEMEIHGESDICGPPVEFHGRESISNIRNIQQASPYVTGFTNPYVINVNDSFSFHIETGDSTIVQIEINAIGTPFGQLLQNGSAFDSLILLDNGNGADEIADDNIFSTGNLTFINSTNYVSGWFLRYCDLVFTYADESSSAETIDLGFGIRRINLQNVAIPTVISIDDSMQRTTHVVNIIDEGLSDITEVTTKYYSKFPDDRDVIMLATTYPTPGAPAASYETVRITEEGTHYNTPLYDNSSDYGSNGKLMGIMRHYYTHGGANHTVNHELLHQWASFLNPDIHLSDNPATGHWGVVEVESSGFGSGWQVSYINQISDTEYWTGRDSSYSSHYNSLEQYLMGLISLDSVNFPMRTLADYEFLGIINGKRTFRSETGILSITQAMFENSMPVRNPDYINSQKHFKSALIVLSDRLLTEQEMAYYDFHMKQVELDYQDPDNIVELGINFQEASYGKAKLETNLLLPSDVAGDVNNDSIVNLTDAILALQVLAGITPSSPIITNADVDGDGKIGIAEVIYVLQVTAGLKAAQL